VSVTIPGSLAEALKPDVLAALEAALAPPPPLRAQTRVEFEIEAAGEGTFTVVSEGGVVSAKKGFAKDPLVSASIGKGCWPLIQKELQALVDGLPGELQKRIDALKAPKPGELDQVIAAVKKLGDVAVTFDIKGAGKYALARGPVDEAGHVLTIDFDASAVDALLAGGPISAFKAKIGGDRGVLTQAASALGPVLAMLR
jgi:hypothetical protein